MTTTNEKVTLVCLFHDSEFAKAAMRDLVAAGIPQEEIYEIGAPDHAGTSAEGSAIGHDIGRFHLPQSDVDMLTKGLDNGGTLIGVETAGNQAATVESIFEKHQASKVDEKTLDAAANVPMAAQTAAFSGATVIPVAEEELAIGKRQVETGRARIYTRVTEKPVEETVTLREEHATIERRAVDTPLTSADANAFRERSIQVNEMAEEPVVAKRARVVEEVLVGKEAVERTERITDSVRKTEVEVEEIKEERRS